MCLVVRFEEEDKVVARVGGAAGGETDDAGVEVC